VGLWLWNAFVIVIVWHLERDSIIHRAGISLFDNSIVM
jgi:hypothetical protein